jgi:hypothetical protein
MPKVSCELFIECKKSDKNWVFYDDPDQTQAFYNVITRYMISNPRGKKGLRKTSNHPESNSTIISTLYQIAGKKQKERDNLFEAQNQVLKAIHYSKDFSTEELKRTLVYPLIVFDGKMFSCRLIDDELEFFPANYIIFFSRGFTEDPYPTLIDIVTLDYLPRYLELVEKETAGLAVSLD